MENFFKAEGLNFHEIYFIYEYNLNDSEVSKLENTKDNADNANTYFEFVDYKDLDKVNVLPETLIDILKE